MAGTCITVIKITGAALLGAAAGVLYTTAKLLPHVHTLISDSSVLRIEREVKAVVYRARGALVGLGLAAVYLLSTAFKYSQCSEKHPYLVYAALTAPIAAGVYAWKLFQAEQTAVQTATTVNTGEPLAPVAKRPATGKRAEVLPLDNSVYMLLSADEQLEKLTPPVLDLEDVEAEILVLMVRNKVNLSLDAAAAGYQSAANILLVGAGLATAGLVGELFL